MWVLEDLINGGNNTAGHFRLGTQLDNVLLGMAAGPGLDHAINARPVRFALLNSAVTPVVRNVVLPHKLGQSGKNLVVSAGYGNPTIVTSRVVTVWADINRRRAHPLADEAKLVIGRRKFVKDTEDRLVEADINLLPNPCRFRRPKRHNDAQRAIEARHVVRQGRRARRSRRTVWVASKERDTTESVSDAAKTRLLPVGAGLPIATDPQHNELRVYDTEDVPTD